MPGILDIDELIAMEETLFVAMTVELEAMDISWKNLDNIPINLYVGD